MVNTIRSAVALLAGLVVAADVQATTPVDENFKQRLRTACAAEILRVHGAPPSPHETLRHAAYYGGLNVQFIGFESPEDNLGESQSAHALREGPEKNPVTYCFAKERQAYLAERRGSRGPAAADQDAVRNREAAPLTAQQPVPANPSQPMSAAATPPSAAPNVRNRISGLGAPNSRTSACLREETVPVTLELASRWTGSLPSPQYGFRGEAIMVTNICDQMVVLYSAKCLDGYAGTAGRNPYESWNAGEQMSVFADFVAFLSLPPGAKHPVAYRGEKHVQRPSSNYPSFERIAIGEVVYGAWDPSFFKESQAIFGRAAVAVHKRLNKVIRGQESQMQPLDSLGRNPADWRKLPHLPKPPPNCAVVDMKSTWEAFAK